MRQRRERPMVGGTTLPMHGWIIDLYAPYVLVRCAEFTNDRSQGLRIGVYTLITVCLMAERLDHLGQLGISVDVVADVVGPDVVCRGGDGGDRADCDGALLISDERMQRLAEALNRLERPLREALVLHHVTGMTVADMAGVLNRPAAEVETRIIQGERLLAQRLSAAEGHNRMDPADARAVLIEFARELDADWLRETRDCVIGYLARCGEHIRWPTAHWHLN